MNKKYNRKSTIFMQHKSKNSICVNGEHDRQPSLRPFLCYPPRLFRAVQQVETIERFLPHQTQITPGASSGLLRHGGRGRLDGVSETSARESGL